MEYIRQQRPDTKWVVHLLTNVTFYLNKLIQHCIGARVVLPDHILKNKAVVALVTPSGHLSTHLGNPWKPSVCTAGTGGNTFWLEILKL
jgi:hypothetical protein